MQINHISKGLTNRSILQLWLPLALSFAMMSISIPIMNAGVARLPDPSVHLAAIGVTVDITVLFESPIIMLLSTSVALYHNKRNFQHLRRVMHHFILFLTCFSALITFTPLFDVVFGKILELPQDVVNAARPAMRVLLLWPAAIAWRRFHQGVLINVGASHLITIGTIIRLVVLTLIIILGVHWGGIDGALLGGVALVASVLAEAAVITLWTIPYLRFDDGSQIATDAQNEPSMTYREVLKFCLPLSVTNILMILTRPLFVMGIARAQDPGISLAAWPVALGLGKLLSSPAWAFSETVIALERDHQSQKRLNSFILLTGILLSSILAIFAFTPLGHIYFADLIGIPIEVEIPANMGVKWLVLFPLLISLRNLLRGRHIRQKTTGSVQIAMATNIVGVAIIFGVGVYLTQITGILLASFAMVFTLLLELVVLSVLDKSRISADSSK